MRWTAPLWVLLCLVGLSWPTSAIAQQPEPSFWHRMKLDWKRRNAWPEPFIYADRCNTWAPFGLMAEKGWHSQNTLGHHHFDFNSQQLTEAGRLKLEWILTQNPPDRRTVFVVRGNNDEMTSVRRDSVQQQTAQLVTTGMLPDIREADLQPRAWSAAEIDAIGRKAYSTMPEPRLPARQATTSGGS